MRKILFVSAILMASLSLWAEPVSRVEALNTARAFLMEKGKSMLQTSEPYRAPRRGAIDESEAASYYVFNLGAEQGYVIVSGDDRTEQILGYVEQGHFDADELPINMKAHLQYYTDVIQHLDENNVQLPSRKNAPRRTSATRHSVPKLMASKWNQGFPYNKHCPIYYNGDGTTGQSVTGCTATAIAQVINYYKHPERTKAQIPAHSNTYTLNNGTKKTVTCKAIPARTPIDWENMCEEYHGNETDEQNDAVGKLMLYVGTAVKMGYGASSGAVHGDNVPELLYKYFDYDDGAYCASRYDYSAQEWEDLLYSELSTGHPLSYQGFSSGGGHAFVIDGYDGIGLYHLNWGWGGGSDGWFVLSILNPGDNSGIGASNSSDGYNMSNNAMIGVRPGSDGQRAESRTCATMNNVTISGSTIKLNFINWTGTAGTFNCGIVEANEDGSVKLVSNRHDMTVDPNYYHTPTFDLKGRLTEGVHRLSPANKLSTNKTYRTLYDMTRTYIEAVVDANKNVQLRLVQPQPELKVESIEFPGTRVAGKEQEVRVTFSNAGDEILQHLFMLAGESNDPSKSSAQKETAVEVLSQGTAVVSFYFTPSNVGTYNVWISSNKSGNETIYAHAQMQAINESEAVKPKLSVSSMSITNVSNGLVYGNFLEGKISIKNNDSKNRFAGRIRLQSWSQNYGEGVAWSSKSTSVYVEAEPLKIATVTFSFDEMRTDCKYWISVNDVTTGNQLTNGGIWDHGWDMHPGVVGWKADGTKAVNSASTTSTASTWCGVYLNGVKSTSLRPNKNSNVIYALAEGISYSKLKGNVVCGAFADTIRLVSDTAYVVPVQFQADYAQFAYRCTPDKYGRWSAFTMPFTPDSMIVNGKTYPLNEDGTPFCLYEFSAEQDNLPVFTPAETLRANAPYLIAFNEDMIGQEILFVATDARFVRDGDDTKVVSSKHYRMFGTSYSPKQQNVYMLNSEGKAFEWVSTSTAVYPMGAYIATSLGEDKPNSLPIPDIPILTGIEQIPATLARPADGSVFQLNGQRIPNGTLLRQGVYIINGHKVLVK